jgi:hypothetical protein
VDEETARFISIRKVKLKRLHELDLQAAAMGEYNTPPHVEMERSSLRSELGMVEDAIAAPAGPEISEELGPSGRFKVYHQQNVEIRRSIAALAIDLERFVQQSQDWRSMHRQWLFIIGIAVVIILLIIVGVVAYVIGHGGI